MLTGKDHIFYSGIFHDFCPLFRVEVGWIQFVNAQGDELFCAVPVIVGLERYGNESILIPWPVGHEVTKKAGNIKFKKKS